MSLIKRSSIPNQAKEIIHILNNNGYEAYLVGGCVRDLLCGSTPADWDICTDATPEQIEEVFNGHRIIETGLQHGTVTLYYGPNKKYEVTTYRVDGNYSDGRHPDGVTWTKNLTEDLARRDFTLNAMALDIGKKNGEEIKVIDPFNGLEHLSKGILTCVGNPDDRFQEDALRILRALRFSSLRNFWIDGGTTAAIHRNYKLLEKISVERIQSELKKIVCGGNFFNVAMEFKDVLTFIIPELEPCIGCDQNNPHHKYDVYTHIMKATCACSNEHPTANIALLLHDIAKPDVKTTDENGIDHFKMHEIASAEKAKAIMKRLKFSTKEIDDVYRLIKFHDSLNGELNKKLIRKTLERMQSQKMANMLIDIRIADIKAQADDNQQQRIKDLIKFETELFEAVDKKVCFSIKDMAINGNDVMGILNCGPGPKVGKVLKNLFNCIIEGSLENEQMELIHHVQWASRTRTGILRKKLYP